MPYHVDHDPYLDKNTGILRNKLGATTQTELDTIEAELTPVWISTLMLGDSLSPAAFNWELLQKIHQELFGQIYDWAGQPRTVSLSAGVTRFAEPGYIVSSAKNIFQDLANDNYLRDLKNHTVVASKLAHYYGELIVVHPFREGNGRAIRTMLALLAENIGWELAWYDLDETENIAACIAAYNGDYAPMDFMFSRILFSAGEPWD